MRAFRIWRKAPPEEYRKGGYANAPGEAQLEGVEFADGTVVVRWLTHHRSWSFWPDFATFEAVHGHPEYESETVWLDVVDAKWTASRHSPAELCDCVNPDTGRRHRELPGDPPYHCAAGLVSGVRHVPV